MVLFGIGGYAQDEAHVREIIRTKWLYLYYVFLLDSSSLDTLVRSEP